LLPASIVSEINYANTKQPWLNGEIFFTPLSADGVYGFYLPDTYTK
jgi:hypothetical protein